MRNPPLNLMTTDSNSDGLVDEYSVKLVTGTPSVTTTIDGGQKIHYDDISARVQVYVNRKSEISNYNWGVGNKLELNCKIKVDGTFYVCSKVYFYNSEDEYITDEEVQSPWVAGSTGGEYVERSIGYDYLSIPTSAYYIEWGMFVDGYSGEDGSAWIKDIEIEAQNIRNDIKSIDVDSSITTSKKKSYSNIASIDVDSSITTSKKKSYSKTASIDIDSNSETIEVEGAKTKTENISSAINVDSSIATDKKKSYSSTASIDVSSSITINRKESYTNTASINVGSNVETSKKKSYSNTASINVDSSITSSKKRIYSNTASINVDSSITSSKKKSYSNIASLDVDSSIETIEVESSKTEIENATTSINVGSTITSSKKKTGNKISSIDVDSSVTLSKKQSFVNISAINVGSSITSIKKKNYSNISEIDVDSSIETIEVESAKTETENVTSSINVGSAITVSKKKTYINITAVNVGSSILSSRSIEQTETVSIDIGSSVTSFIKKTETKIASIDVGADGSIVNKIKTITKIASIDVGASVEISYSYGTEDDVMWELQVAMYDELKENLTLMNLIENRLYDSVPTNEEYPYVKMGLCSANDDDTHGNEGYELTKTFHIYTKPYGLGFYTAMQIFEQLNNSLNCKSLSMTNYDMTICKLDNMFTETQNDKNIVNAIYKVLCTAK